jgi:threonine dehydrogenase-like Zn-dependent dehydrogenase
MRGTVRYAPRDVRVKDRPDPKIEKPTDAVIRLAATCICGSDLWRYRGIEDVDGPARVKDLTGGLGAHSVIEAVGTQESMMQAIRATRPGGHVGYVGVAHGVELPGQELFFSHVHLHGGPAPVRRFLPELIELICNRKINPGKVFDLEMPLDQAAEGYRAMDERRSACASCRTASSCRTRRAGSDRASPRPTRRWPVIARDRQHAHRRGPSHQARRPVVPASHR